MLNEILLLDRAEDEEGEKSEPGLGGEGFGVPSWVQEHRLASDGGAEWVATAERLRGADHVGRDVRVLDGPPAPGPPQARLHLIRDEEGSVLVSDLAQALEEAGRRHDHATFAGHGFDD